MKTVLASGVFDLLHPGHIYFLSEAKKLGDRLIVVVTSDRTAVSQKRWPFFSQTDRLKLVQSLRMVDQAVLGREGEGLASVIDIQPDIIAIGWDQFKKIPNSKFQIPNKPQISKSKYQTVDIGIHWLHSQLKQLGWNGKIVKIGRMPGTIISSSRMKKIFYEKAKSKNQKEK